MSWSTIGGAIGSIWGPVGAGVGSIAGGLLDRDQAKSDAAQTNQWSAEAQARQFGFNAEEAQKNRDWQERMSNSAYQRATDDMMAAGLNPMLAYQQGGASTPSGGAASGGNFSGATIRGQAQYGGMSAAQISLAEAQADESRSRASYNAQLEAESAARTPLHGARIREIEQKIEESVARIQEILQNVETGKASASLMAANRQKVLAEIPHIEQSIKNLKSLVHLNNAQIIEIAERTSKTKEEVREITQRISANLPDLEAKLRILEAAKEGRDVPRQTQEEALHGDPILGAAASIVKLLNPFQSLFVGNTFRRPAK